MKKVLISVSNDLSTDQRVAKICESFVEFGFDVELVGRRLPNSKTLTECDYKRFRFLLLFTKGFLFYAEFNIRLFFYLFHSKYDVLYSNDLDTLLPNYLVSKLKRKKLIYDSHELFTEVPELQGRFAKKVWERIENFIFPKLKYVFTVNQSIADIFEEKYKVRVGVMRNFPKSMCTIFPMIAKELGLPNEKKIIILQGAGINIDRGAEEAVEMMHFIENAILLIIGGGDVIEILKNKIKEEKLDSRIFFFDKMPYNELLRYSAMADLGLSLDKDSNLNYKYSLPNKIMDYVHAGTPVLASNLIEVKNIVEKYQIGLISHEYSAENFGKIAQEMLLSNFKKTHYEQLKNAANKLCWENEVENLKIFLNQ